MKRSLIRWMESLLGLKVESIELGKRKRRSGRNSSTRIENDCAYMNLEERRLLASFYLDPNGTFYIKGTESNDAINVAVSGSNVRATVNATTQVRPVSAVNELVFLGVGGDDFMVNNTSIRSRMYGGNGNDTLYGGWGDDILVGNAGNDTMYGRDGNDVIRGSVGSNTIYGGNGNDKLYGGFGGKNVILGGAGNDIVYAGDRGDEIRGQAGDDQLYGGLGDDLIYGGDGADILMGWHGNDSLYSDGNNNRLYGGTGNDGLFAGMGTGNRIFPGEGKDRILITHGESVPQVSAEDAVIRFASRSANWNYFEIEALDRGLRALHHRANSTKILKDTTSNDPLSIYKYQVNDPTLFGHDGLNYHSISVTVHPNGTRTETYTREIRIEDFDENDSHAYRMAGLLLIHEISHSWDSAYEIGRVVAANSVWPGFLALSGWTNQNPNSSAYSRAPVNTQEVFEYEIVGGQLQIPVRQWWYLNSSAFARSYGTSNAKEDWGVTWESAFVEEVYGPAASLGITLVPAKIAQINQLFQALT